MGVNSPIGTAERFQQFVENLLLNISSDTILYKGYKHIEHIAPMVGSIYLANFKEQSLNIYRLEQFDDDWRKLANNTGEIWYFQENWQMMPVILNHMTNIIML